jgi:hypothetical protein
MSHRRLLASAALALLLAGVVGRAALAQGTGTGQIPVQQGSSLNAANINHDSLKALEAMKRLKQLESLRPPGN